MTSNEADKDGCATLGRAKSNRAAYVKEKQRQDRLLLRLDKGSAADIDAAAGKAGLSRAAFARMYLAPCLAALGSRSAAIERARAADGRSLARFLSDAIDHAASAGQLRNPPRSVGCEVDELFMDGAPGSKRAEPGVPFP